VTRAQGQLENLEQVECLLLEAVTIALVKTQLTGKTVVNCRVCEIMIAPELIVVMGCKRSTNPFTIPNSIYSHS
jgi:hypothetical protein